MGGDLHITCRIRLKTGEERWVQIDRVCERSDSGEPLLLVGVVADITERKILEQHAVELCERLINVQGRNASASRRTCMTRLRSTSWPLG